MERTSAEFFAGMGLVRAGLEKCGVRTLFANDIDKTKGKLYTENWGDDALVIGDVCKISGDDVPTVDVATSSFPCTDFSLAGDRAGLDGEHSSLILEFCRIISEMGDRAPEAIIVENVPGFLTANGGTDFSCVVELLREMGYEVAHVCIDAAAFVPQSRIRVFILASKSGPCLIPDPPIRASKKLADVVSDDNAWWVGKQRDYFFTSLSPLQAQRLRVWAKSDAVSWRGAYRRTRNGNAVWEIRHDELAGALRTTSGGSSRQAIVRSGDGRADVRWMNVEEYARLQGADGMSYTSVSCRQAMFALGDAVCVPVVEWIGNNWLAKVWESANHRK